MKKMFLAAMAASLVLSVTANAADDDYDDTRRRANDAYNELDGIDGDDSYSKPTQNFKSYDDEKQDEYEQYEGPAAKDEYEVREEESSSTVQKTRTTGNVVTTPVSNNDEDEEPAKRAKMSNKTGNEKFMDKGFTMTLGYTGFYDTPKNSDWSDDVYGDWVGIDMTLGGAIKLNMLPFFNIIAGVDFGVKCFFRDYGSDGYYYDEEDQEYKENTVEENSYIFSIEAPLLARINLGELYVEGGMKFGLNIANAHTLSDKKGNEEDVTGGKLVEKLTSTEVTYNVYRDWQPADFVYALIVGAGISYDLPKLGKMDIGFRVVVDFSELEDFSKENDAFAAVGATDYEIHTKNWSIQLFLAGWL